MLEVRAKGRHKCPQDHRERLRFLILLNLC